MRSLLDEPRECLEFTNGNLCPPTQLLCADINQYLHKATNLWLFHVYGDQQEHSRLAFSNCIIKAKESDLKFIARKMLLLCTGKSCDTFCKIPYSVKRDIFSHEASQQVANNIDIKTMPTNGIIDNFVNIL